MRSPPRVGLLLLATSITCASPAPIGTPSSRLALAKAAADRIRVEDVRRDVSYLGSDANMGRRTPHPGVPSPGYDSAAAYVARELRAMGVRPMGDNGSYFQYYTVTRSTLDTSRVTGRVGGEPLRWGEDFVISSFLVGGVREANVIYVGNGVRLLKQGVDPYAGFDIKDKWLLVNAPPPGGRGGGARGGGGAAAGGGRGAPAPTGVIGIDYTTINEVARHGQALGILYVPTGTYLTALPRLAVTGQDLNPSVGVAYAQYQVPRVVLSPGGLRRLLTGTRLSAEALLRADSTRQYPAPVDLGGSKRLRIEMPATTVEARPYNVVALLEGSDARLKEEWISLAAHLDGAVPANAAAPGNNLPDQFNAADDNASGSAGNLAIVRALLAAPRPRRSILLIWDSGEENGLWGTRTIAYGPWSEKLVLHISNDMVGRSRPPNSPRDQNLSASDTIYVTGPKLLSTVAQRQLDRGLAEFPYMKVDQVYEDISSEFYYPRTDAGPYLERGIPILQFFNGLHIDYHRATDDVAKLDITKIVNVSKLSFGILWLTADDPVKPVWDGIVPRTLWWVTPRRR
jgi:hypothetical protein